MKNIIFKAIVGSQSYGTAIEGKSDIDYKGVYMQNNDELLSFGYKEQINVTKDETYYEVRRFLELLQSGNPTVLELLYSPQECIIESSPVFDLIVQNRDKFLTQKCLMSFGGYCIAQLKKSRGLDKKMNWEQSKVERKTPLDFCYVYEKGKTIPVEQWLKNTDSFQEFCGLVALNHFKDCYALYYDNNFHINKMGYVCCPDCPEQKVSEEIKAIPPLGFHGITLSDSNDIRLSSVPMGIEPEIIMNYNKDAYSNHCRDYNEYQNWLNNRNTQRYVDVEGHGQKIDGKNLLHCRRLLDTAAEIATQKTINVKRPNADYLLNIRRGEVPLQEIIDKAEVDIIKLNELFANSGLPKDVDKNFVNELLLKIRKYEKY